MPPLARLALVSAVVLATALAAAVPAESFTTVAVLDLLLGDTALGGLVLEPAEGTGDVG